MGKEKICNAKYTHNKNLHYKVRYAQWWFIKSEQLINILNTKIK